MAGINKLSDRQVKNAPIGKLNDGGGLWLIKRKDGGAQWIYRFSLFGKRPEMGLGSYPLVSLADARTVVSEWRKLVVQGINPIKERERQRRAAAKARPTLAEMTIETLEARKRQLVDNGKAGRWDSPLRLHVLPILGQTPIEDIDQRDIKKALSKLWHTKPETARKAMSRLGLIFAHATAAGLDVDIQAPVKAKALLGAQSDIAQRIPALHWQDVPAFYESINEQTITQLALRLLILTGLRSKPIRFLHTDHIEGDILTVPADLMKGAKGKTSEFRVPLSEHAQSIINQAMAFERKGFLFPNTRGGVISDATMSRFMERRKMVERPHGFRSSLRTWCAETTQAPREVAETILGHVSGGKVELAYRRTDYLDQRRVLMERWAAHCTGKNGQLLRFSRD
jgi:integrase